jgi:hypothetical protein
MVFGFNQKRRKKNKGLIDFMGSIPKPENLLNIARNDSLEFTHLGMELFSGSKSPRQRRGRSHDERLTDERESILRSGGNVNDGFEDHMNSNGRDLFGRPSKYRFDNNRIYAKDKRGIGVL